MAPWIMSDKEGEAGGRGRRGREERERGREKEREKERERATHVRVQPAGHATEAVRAVPALSRDACAGT